MATSLSATKISGDDCAYQDGAGGSFAANCFDPALSIAVGPLRPHVLPPYRYGMSLAARVNEKLARVPFRLAIALDVDGGVLPLYHRLPRLIDAIWQQFTADVAGMMACTDYPAPGYGRCPSPAPPPAARSILLYRVPRSSVPPRVRRNVEGRRVETSLWICVRVWVRDRDLKCVLLDPTDQRAVAFGR